MFLINTIFSLLNPFSPPPPPRPPGYGGRGIDDVISDVIVRAFRLCKGDPLSLPSVYVQQSRGNVHPPGGEEGGGRGGRGGKEEIGKKTEGRNWETGRRK